MNDDIVLLRNKISGKVDSDITGSVDRDNSHFSESFLFDDHVNHCDHCQETWSKRMDVLTMLEINNMVVRSGCPNAKQVNYQYHDLISRMEITISRI